MKDGPIKLLQLAITKLENYQCQYALVGGLAASLYRLQPRLTKDVDLALLANDESISENLAVQLVTELKLKPTLVTAAQLKKSPSMNKKSSPKVLVVGSIEGSSLHNGLDVVLPSMIWVKSAISRAQNNIVDFGFAKIPVITVEDLIISKIFSLSDNISRYKDLDDLQNIFAKEQGLDFVYLINWIEKYSLSFPHIIKKDLPKILRAYTKKKVARRST